MATYIHAHVLLVPSTMVLPDQSRLAGIIRVGIIRVGIKVVERWVASCPEETQRRIMLAHRHGHYWGKSMRFQLSASQCSNTPGVHCRSRTQSR
jgi:hypothetical protein